MCKNVCKTRYSKRVRIERYAVFYGVEILKMNRKSTKIDLPERGFEPQIFSNFPAHDWIFHGR